MPTFQTSRRVQHSADDMFDLVADVEKYPRFVPLCQSLKVRGRREMDDGRVVLISDMTVAYKLFSETFASRVTLDREARRITVEYLEGPFRHLENNWDFKPLDDGTCEVGFFITYEFRSRTLGSLMGAMFDRAFRKFASAFEERADEIYGAV
ncbi:coenzyme Q-binding protein COQ10 [Breoghania corrubedonensis]|uniref:Coenzyme Q-binding protein COQ10 n=1 Tax=Breoghania corrubedonensis TaxID=665038 RepID=A0A2T5V923_9HYPH|nr:type II toxin-antitoxin system RatA family toxin [Breoghania corrubedonensis]PTW60259.1 coenzyme Q-binding protein COQ10 [Breoghania corrubedonensis]